MMSGDEHDTSLSRRTDLAPQRGRHGSHRRNRTARAAIPNDKGVQPPLRIESDQAQTADIHRHRSWTAIARNKAHVPALRERGDHPLLKSNRVEPERSFVGPVVIARYENSSRAGRNRLDLCLESAASIGPLRGAFGGNAPRINVVAEKTIMVRSGATAACA